MPTNISNAVQAYDAALRNGSSTGLEARDKPAGVNFGDFLKDATENVVDTLQQTEAQTLKAATGSANLDEVVVAVTQAEMTLSTVVSIRDKVIQAYQEIIRMPI